MEKPRYLYMLVEQDEYELPLIVANSPAELSRKIGVSVNAIISNARHYEAGRIKRSRYQRVPFEE